MSEWREKELIAFARTSSNEGPETSVPSAYVTLTSSAFPGFGFDESDEVPFHIPRD